MAPKAYSSATPLEAANALAQALLILRREEAERMGFKMEISTHAPTPGATAKTTKKQGCFHKKQTIFTSIILCLFLVVKCSMRFLENHLKNLVPGCRTFLFA